MVDPKGFEGLIPFNNGSEERHQVTKSNWQAISNGWNLMDPKIKTDADFDIKHIENLDIQLSGGSLPMQLVFQRTTNIEDEGDALYSFDLNLYKSGSELRGRAPSGLMIMWSFDRDHYCVSTTELRSLVFYSGHGLGAALFKLSDKIITTKIIPLVERNPKHRGFPVVGVIEDCAEDLKKNKTRWTTFQAQQLGYEVTGKNGYGWPLLTKKFI